MQIKLSESEGEAFGNMLRTLERKVEKGGWWAGTYGPLIRLLREQVDLQTTDPTARTEPVSAPTSGPLGWDRVDADTDPPWGIDGPKQ